MSFAVAIFAAALTVAPSDRLAMADRLFNRGECAEASREYESLVGEKSVDAAALGLRRVRCAHELGKPERVRQLAAEFLKEHPGSPEADEVRYFKALAASGGDRVPELRELDAESVSADVRVRALCELGAATRDVGCFDRALKLQPKGAFAPYAHFRRAALNAASPDKVLKVAAMTEFIDLAFGPANPYGEDALYSAAVTAESCGRIRDAQSLAKRFLRRYPKNAERAAQLRVLLAVIELNGGRNAAALEYCGDLVGADAERVRALARARMDFEKASGANDTAAMIESARRSAELSKSSSDRLRHGWALEKAGRAEESEAIYEEVARDFPGTADAADALYRRGLSLLRRSKWSAAALSLGEALSSGLAGDRRAAALYWKGVACVSLKHLDEGAALLKDAIKAGLGPDESREARLILADIDFNAGRREAALVEYAALLHLGAADRMSAKKLHALGGMLPAAEAKICGEALIRSDAPEWRQCGYALVGDAEDRLGHQMAAVEAWTKALDEKATTESAGPVSLKLAKYRLSVSDLAQAEELFKRAVAMNPKNREFRAAAYLGLAECSLAKNDVKSAKGYATVVLTLFENTSSATRAAEIAGNENRR